MHKSLNTSKANVSHTHNYAAASHNHDTRYYTESEIDAKLANVVTASSGIRIALMWENPNPDAPQLKLNSTISVNVPEYGYDFVLAEAQYLANNSKPIFVTVNSKTTIYFHTHAVLSGSFTQTITRGFPFDPDTNTYKIQGGSTYGDGKGDYKSGLNTHWHLLRIWAVKIG